MAHRTARAIVLSDFGSTDHLQLRSVDLPDPGAGEIRLRQTAIGVNYHDIYVRTGFYRTLALPGTPGIEAVGMIEALGEGVEDLQIGDRIGYVSGQYGGYAEARNLPAALALKLPDQMSDVQAAATLMRSLTACMLLRRVHLVSAAETILVHAAAGGMGQLLCRWASGLGAKVIGTVGSAGKAAIAHASGAEEVILYREEDVAARIADITGNTGVDVVYDAIGADTFSSSMQSLAFCGHLVNYGQASGAVPPIALSDLASRSLTVSRPIIFHYLRTKALLDEMARETFAALEQGLLSPIDPVTFPLEQVGEAHFMLEKGQNPGGIVLLP